MRTVVRNDVARDQSTAPRWLITVAALLPLGLLFIAFAAGIAIPLWLFLAVLAWSLLMPAWTALGAASAGETDGTRSRIAGEARDIEPRIEQLNTLHRLEDLIDPAVFEVTGSEVSPTGFVFHGRLRATPEDVQAHVVHVAGALLGRTPHVMVHEDAQRRPYLLVASRELDTVFAQSVPPRRPLVNAGLFAATLVTTTFAGAAHQGVNLFERPEAWTLGLPYGLGVMLILGVHEMGHYLAGRYHGVPVSLPYFIPLPFALGTFGAFIRLPPLLKTRRQLFDIGVAGPLAGLAVAIPALALGLRWSTVLPAETVADAGVHMQGVSVNASMLLTLVSKLAIGKSLSTGHYLVLHPLAFAGWLGLMITALNLLPVGQLDGGHVARALFGQSRAQAIGSATIFGMVALGLFVWSGLLFWALVVFFIAGTPGMPPMEDVTPIDTRRRALAWFSFALLALILLPFPHALSPEIGLHCPYL
jgi:membrane-associated protease RseP (regulator of RpoE activity)